MPGLSKRFHGSYSSCSGLDTLRDGIGSVGRGCLSISIEGAVSLVEAVDHKLSALLTRRKSQTAFVSSTESLLCALKSRPMT